MVLRPIHYLPGTDEYTNMQYPNQEPPRRNEETWQMPYGSREASSIGGSYPQSQAYDQHSLPPYSPYTAAVGESTEYYRAPRQAQTSGAEYSDQVRYSQFSQSLDVASGYERASQFPPRTYDAHEQPVAYDYGTESTYAPFNIPPEVKQEAEPNAYGRWNASYTVDLDAPRPEPTQSSVDGCAAPAAGTVQDRGIMGAMAGATAGGYAGKLH